MAIVNEDVRIVKLLLDHGANVHERCLGTFFLPIDQKERANDPIRAALERASSESRRQRLASAELARTFDLASNAFASPATNYDG